MDEVIKAFMPAVYQHLSRLSIPRCVEKDDVVSAGMLGIWLAVESYDPNKGQFSTIAFHYIRGKMNNCLRDATRQVARSGLDYWVDLYDDEDGDSAALVDTLAGNTYEPEPILMKKLQYQRTVTRIWRLCKDDIDRKMVRAWLNGDTYEEAAKNTGLTRQALYNRVMRRFAGSANAIVSNNNSRVKCVKCGRDVHRTRTRNKICFKCSGINPDKNRQHKATCRKCGTEKARNSIKDGYCLKCSRELGKIGKYDRLRGTKQADKP